MDFTTRRGRARLVKKAFDQFKADGELAPLAAHLPSELSAVPRQQLRVCEAAVQMSFSQIMYPEQTFQKPLRLRMLGPWGPHGSPRKHVREKMSIGKKIVKVTSGVDMTKPSNKDIVCCGSFDSDGIALWIVRSEDQNNLIMTVGRRFRIAYH